MLVIKASRFKIFGQCCESAFLHGQVGEAMLAGELAYRQGKFDEGFQHLRMAVQLEDALPYDEPSGYVSAA